MFFFFFLFFFFFIQRHSIGLFLGLVWFDCQIHLTLCFDLLVKDPISSVYFGKNSSQTHRAFVAFPSKIFPYFHIVFFFLLCFFASNRRNTFIASKSKMLARNMLSTLLSSERVSRHCFNIYLKFLLLQ